MAGNNALKEANRNKNDEFYTQLPYIESELKHYRNFFNGKIVYCNCDDPFESNFFKYFAMNFNFLGLKKLISVSFAGSPVVGNELGMFDDQGRQYVISPKKAYKVVMSELKDTNNDGCVDLFDVEEIIRHRIKYLKGDGSFESKECKELLDQADVVVTNPPFSLFREYVSQLIDHDKKFLIVGPQNAITYKESFHWLKTNKMWLGYNSGDMVFTVPDYYEPRATRYWVGDDGTKYRSLGNICWFTNIDIEKRHEDLIVFKKYTPDEYPEYVNYDGINCDKVVDIPCDYDGVIGVPITFLSKHNPDQFEIVDLGIVGSCEFKNNRKMEILDKNGQPTGRFTMNAKGTLYRRYNPEKDKRPAFRDVENGDLYSSIYARVLIRRKK